MADYDKKHGKKVVSAIAPLVRTATVTSNAIDTLGFRAVTVASYFGAGGITFDETNRIDVKVTHSEDGVTYDAVEADDMIMPYGETVAAGGIIRSLTAAKAAADTEHHTAGYIGKRRYVKAQIAHSGTHGTGTMGQIHVDLEKPDNLPVGQADFVPTYPNKTAQ